MLNKEHFSVAEVAKIIGFSRQTISKAIAKGELKTFTVGNRPRIARKALTEYQEAKGLILKN